MNRKLYQHLASRIDAMANCEKSGNTEWFARHRETANALARDFLPSGSGIDAGCTVNFDKSSGEKLVIHTAFHHMNDGGYYDGWTDRTVTVRASLVYEIDIHISGRDRNDVKDYLSQAFRDSLTTEIDDTEHALAVA